MPDTANLPEYADIDSDHRSRKGHRSRSKVRRLSSVFLSRAATMFACVCLCAASTRSVFMLWYKLVRAYFPLGFDPLVFWSDLKKRPKSDNHRSQTPWTAAFLKPSPFARGQAENRAFWKWWRHSPNFIQSPFTLTEASGWAPPSKAFTTSSVAMNRKSIFDCQTQHGCQPICSISMRRPANYQKHQLSKAFLGLFDIKWS